MVKPEKSSINMVKPEKNNIESDDAETEEVVEVEKPETVETSNDEDKDIK